MDDNGHHEMSYAEYQERRREFARYPNQGSNVLYPVLSIAEEAGEIAGVIGKAIRKNEDGILDTSVQGICALDNEELKSATRDRFIDEVGDLMWQVDAALLEYGVTLEEVLYRNIKKLSARRKEAAIVQ